MIIFTQDEGQCQECNREGILIVLQIGGRLKRPNSLLMCPDCAEELRKQLSFEVGIKK